MKRQKAAYAIPCLLTEHSDFRDDEIFFLAFATRDEEEALKLAACICGKEMAPKSLVMISEEGDVIPVF